MKRPLAHWAAIVVPMWIGLALCAYWEPVVRDGWGHVQWHRTHDASYLWAFAKATYLHNNPRIGQVIALLLYTPGGWHVAITPVVELSLFYLLAALAVGRWPSLRRSDDALLYLTVAAIGLVTAPCIGQMLFYRPYTGNYVYPLALMLLLLVPYRFHAEQPRRFGIWLAPVLFVLGVAAGLGNEHTGLAIAAAIGCAIVACIRRRERVSVWMIAGLVGLAIGYTALLLAPGHTFRYAGVATKTATTDLLAERGVLGNARIIGQLLLHVAFALPWLAIAWWRRGGPRTRATVLSSWVAVGAGVLATLALFASPRFGDRLYFASTMLITIAIASWVHAQVAARRYVAALSALAICVIGWLCVPPYRQLGPASKQRLEALDRAAPGTTVILERFPVEKSYFTVGEDLDDAEKRATIAGDRGLTAIELAK